MFRPVKTTAQASGASGTVGGVLRGLCGAGASGYEIHMAKPRGTRRPAADASARGRRVAVLGRGPRRSGAYGTYLHGLFDMPDAAQALVRWPRAGA